jgi:hypothetical protein
MVFVLKAPDQLVPMKPTQFAEETDFQKLLVDFPELLCGDQIDPDHPRRWIIVAAEKSIAAQQGGSARWFLDILLLDQDGIPTLVEVKRKSDPRLRREVVGQMLDYAANAAAYWPVEELISTFELTLTKTGAAPEDVLRRTLGVEDTEEFWRKVKTNLRDHRVRMLFVADSIPTELKRVVEFLNEQMDPAEALALELRQYTGEGLRTIVPVLYGQTQDAQRRKAVGPGRVWTEATVIDELSTRFGADVAGAAKRIAAWLKEHSLVWFGRGRQEGSIRASFDSPTGKINAINIWTYGKIEVNFGSFENTPLASEDKRKQLLAMLNAVDGAQLKEDAINRYPGVSIRLFVDEGNRVRLFEALAWLKAELNP